MLENDPYDILLSKYFNIRNEIEIAYRHKLSPHILEKLKKEQSEVKAKLDDVILTFHSNNVD